MVERKQESLNALARKTKKAVEASEYKFRLLEISEDMNS